MNARATGLLITFIGMLFVTPDSLFVRLIDAEPMVIAFWRGLTSGILIFAILLLAGGRLGRLSDLPKLGWAGVIYAMLLGSTTIGFVMAIGNTSVANAVFIFATLPLFSAAFSWLFLGERISRSLGVTMILALIGLAIIAYGSGKTEAAHWSGDLWAVFVSAAYGAALTAVRRVRDVPLVPVLPFAFIGCAACLALVTDPWPILAEAWPLILAHGTFIAIATCFLTLGPRYISAPEVGLLVLVESVLAPLLVWLVLSEAPGAWALFGGAIVIGGLVVYNAAMLRKG
ncbi:MAG: DMT family transporter [Pseudomonadota bacterium]